MQRGYEKLIVWQEADDLCVFTYIVTKKFPPEEKYNLVSQMRKSSSSVPTNIVEGNMRQTVDDKAHFFVTALSSLEELHYQFHLSFRLGYINQETRDKAYDKIQRVSYLLTRLRTVIRSKN